MKKMYKTKRWLLISVTLSLCLIPRDSEGVQCLQCSTEERSSFYDSECGKTDPKQQADCPEGTAGCLFQAETDERYIKRDCMPSIYLSCLKSVFGMKIEDGKCEVKEGLTVQQWETFNDCETEKMKPAIGAEAVVGEEQGTGEAGAPASTTDESTGGNAGSAPKEILQQGPGSRGDITQIEVCFCTKDKCNTNAIKPSAAAGDDIASAGDLKPGLFLIFLVLGLGLIQ